MHGHDHGSPRKGLLVALVLTLGFSGVEVAVGVWSGSLALLADAGHMLGDSAALALSFFVAVLASRPRSAAKTYGYRRAEVLGALANACMLVVVAVWIVTEAASRLGHPPEVRGAGMLAAASAGLGINLGAAWVLSRTGGDNINVRAAMFHVLGDALGSVAAIIAGLLLLTLGWRLADPLASLAIALLILMGAFRLLRETTHVLMEGTPEGLSVAELERTIVDTPGVRSLHDLHVWALTPGQPVLTAHVVLDREAHGTDVARAVGQRLRASHGIEHVTVQPESPDADLVELRIARTK